MPVPPDVAARIRRAAHEAARWRAERDRAIAEARATGCRTRELAALAGWRSHVSVLNATRRTQVSNSIEGEAA